MNNTLLKSLYLYKYVMNKPNMPSKISIETTNHCNYNCIMCNHRTMKRKKGIMDYNLFKRVVDECSDIGIKVIRPQYAGEPLLDKRFPDMLKYIHSKGIYTHITTTGYLLNNNLSKEIINSGCDVITFSFHGNDKEEYKLIHGIDGYDKCIKNVKKFYEIRENLNKEKPNIVVQAMKCSKNNGDVNHIREVFEQYSDRFKETTCSYNKLVMDNDLRLNKSQTHRKVPCMDLLSRIVVLIDGTVTICCVDMEGDLAIGHIDDGILNLFKSKGVKKIRRAHLYGKYPPLCKYCDQDSV